MSPRCDSAELSRNLQRMRACSSPAREIPIAESPYMGSLLHNDQLLLAPVTNVECGLRFYSANARPLIACDS